MPLSHAGRVKISIVIPCYKRAELAAATVSSALAQDLDPHAFEVIAVDSSPDSSVVNALEALRSQARCRFTVLRKKAEGPGPSRNLGAATSTGEFIAFLDSDCEATPGWLRALAESFESGVGIVQGRTLPAPGKRQGILSHTIRVETESFIYETANVAYRRHCFEEAGGFWADWAPEAATPLGGEDVDLAWRVKRKGWTSRFAYSALVYHEVLPMHWGDWFWISRLAVFPLLLRRYPELRRFFFGGYFLDRHQAFLLLGLAALVFTPLSPFFLVLWGPYIWSRASGETRSLRGPLRLLRPVFYSCRDFCSLIILMRSSIRFRTLLL